MNFLNHLLYHIRSRLDPVKTAKKLGVKVGKGCSFAGMPNFGSEPYLIEIGNQVRTSSQVSFITHDGATWCFRRQERYKKVIRFGKIVVGDNCFLGFRSTILPGVTIGENSIVGACALVTKDVPPNSVVGGVPARVICTTQEFAEKCLRETPEYDESAMKQNKRKELERIFGGENHYAAI